MGAWTFVVIRECLADFSINCMWRHLPLISNVFERICAVFVQFSTKISHELLKFCAKKRGEELEKLENAKKKVKQKPTAPSVPRRSPIQVLTRLNIA